MFAQSPIPHFMIIPSAACPAECSYCFGPHEGTTMSQAILQFSLDFIETIIRGTSGNKIKITFHGGEPLCAGIGFFEHALTQIADRFGHRDVQVKIQSNLWLLDEAFCHLFHKHKVMLGTSLDGPEKITDTQRGTGYFEKTMHGINLARHHGLKVGCIATLTSGSAKNWRSIIDFFIAQRLNLSLHAAVPGLEFPTHPFHLLPQDYAEVITEIFDYYLEKTKDIRISSLDQLVRGVCGGRGEVCTFQDCLGMFLAIDPEGGMYSCQRLCGKQKYQLGHVKTMPDVESLMHSDAAKQLKIIQNKMKLMCSQCPHEVYCKGGCLYNALAANTFKDPYCKTYQTIFLAIQQKLMQDFINGEAMKAIGKKENYAINKAHTVFNLIEQYHPSQTTRHAKKIITAVALARNQQPKDIVDFFLKQGWSDQPEAIEASVCDLLRQVKKPHTRMNNLYIHITGNCQLNCPHCYASARKLNNSPQELSVDVILDLIRQAYVLGFRQCVITGGEPLMHSARQKLFKQISAMRQTMKPLKFVLRTNFMVTLTFAEQKMLAQAFDQVVVSVDGDQAVHEMRRGLGSYAVVVAHCEQYQNEVAMLAGSAQLSLAAVVEDNEKKMQVIHAVKALAQRLHIQRTRIRPLLPLGRASYLKHEPVAQTLHHCMDFSQLLKEGIQITHNCGLGQNLYIDPAGVVYPCYAHYQTENRLGSIFETDLKEILASPCFAKHQSKHVDHDLHCQACEYKYLCGGMCHAWDQKITSCKALYEKAEKLYHTALAWMGEEIPEKLLVF